MLHLVINGITPAGHWNVTHIDTVSVTMSPPCHTACAPLTLTHISASYQSLDSSSQFIIGMSFFRLSRKTISRPDFVSSLNPFYWNDERLNLIRKDIRVKRKNKNHNSIMSFIAHERAHFLLIFSQWISALNFCSHYFIRYDNISQCIYKCISLSYFLCDLLVVTTSARRRLKQRWHTKLTSGHHSADIDQNKIWNDVLTLYFNKLFHRRKYKFKILYAHYSLM